MGTVDYIKDIMPMRIVYRVMHGKQMNKRNPTKTACMVSVRVCYALDLSRGLDENLYALSSGVSSQSFALWSAF